MSDCKHDARVLAASLATRSRIPIIHMSFHYRAKDNFGHIRDGQLDAATVEEAAQMLRRDGYSVLELHPEAAEELGGLFPRRIRKYDLIYVTNQLAIMVDTGITLSAALGSILQQEQNPSMRRILGELKSAVESGDDFSTALSKHPKVFDKTYVSLIRASEATGKLGEMLNRVGAYLRKEVETRGKVRAAMA